MLLQDIYYKNYVEHLFLSLSQGAIFYTSQSQRLVFKKQPFLHKG